jgi:hypothetical protein
MIQKSDFPIVIASGASQLSTDYYAKTLKNPKVI